VGNPVKRTDEMYLGAFTTTYRYDDVYRLTEETVKNPYGQPEYDIAYGYDAVGNRTSGYLDGVTTTYVYDNNDKLTSATDGSNSATFGYDGSGNMTSVSGSLLGAWSLTFDDECRPTSISYPGGTDTYQYNVLGKRYYANLNGTERYYEYSGDRISQERDAQGTVVARRTYEDASYFGAWLHQGGISRWPLFDACPPVLCGGGLATRGYLSRTPAW
jgi:YD repeat-containing protein